MLDMELKALMDKTTKVWNAVSEILDMPDTDMNDACNIIMTINARFLTGITKLIPKEELGELKEQYLLLIKEKLGE